MATSSKSMKGFYRQRKNTGGITKSKSSKPLSGKKSALHAAAFGSDVAQTPALFSHGGSADLKDDYDQNEQVLRQFDMNMAYGPCLGMTRLARWERAQRLGLNPPEEIKSLLNAGKALQRWEKRTPAK